MNPWADFWRQYAETLGVAVAFAFGGSAFVLWTVPDTTVRSGLLVIFSGLLVTAAASVFVHGYLGWSAYLAPVVGIVSGLSAMPLLYAVRKGIADQAGDIISALLKRVTGTKDTPT